MSNFLTTEKCVECMVTLLFSTCTELRLHSVQIGRWEVLKSYIDYCTNIHGRQNTMASSVKIKHILANLLLDFLLLHLITLIKYKICIISQFQSSPNKISKCLFKVSWYCGWHPGRNAPIIPHQIKTRCLCPWFRHW